MDHRRSYEDQHGESRKDRKSDKHKKSYHREKRHAPPSSSSSSSRTSSSNNSGIHLTNEMWDSPACRAAIRVLIFGQALPLAVEEKFSEFVELFLIRRKPTQRGEIEEGGGRRILDERGVEKKCPIDLPKEYNRAYCINFSIQLNDVQKAQKMKSEREAEFQLKESFQNAFNAGNKAKNRENIDREIELLKVLLSPNKANAKYEGEIGALKEIQNLAKYFLDFKFKRSFNAVHSLIQTKSELPITSWEERIIQTLSTNSVILVAGDTGCGKSTQVPQFLLNAGYGKVACTQPRRVACVALAKRVPQESFDRFGGGVGYQIRFEGESSRRTKLLFLTEGLLLKQIRNDPLLEKYDVVVVDEVHERHLSCDILLSLLKIILKSRNLSRHPLKLVLMSATLNATLFSDYFDQAPIIEVPGRMYPVSTHYMPNKNEDSRIDPSHLNRLFQLEQDYKFKNEVYQNLELKWKLFQKERDDDQNNNMQIYEKELKNEMDQSKLESDEAQLTCALAFRKFRKIKKSFDPKPYVLLLEQIDASTPSNERGDLLVFLGGMSDLSSVASALKDYATKSKKWIILLLHSALDAKEQDKVFAAAPQGIRKCVLSTNIAESSVTIQGIRFVADSGRSKELSWEPESNTSSLQEFYVSKASANQRKGRAGRTGPGVCFRLYHEEVYEKVMPLFADPEASRAPVTSTILELKSLGCKDPFNFPFITCPPKNHLLAALLSLSVLGATHSNLITILPFLFDKSKTYEGLSTGSCFNEKEGVVDIELLKNRLQLFNIHTSTVESLLNTSMDKMEQAKNQQEDHENEEINSGMCGYDVLSALRVDVGVAALTPLGQLMSDLPIDPPISRMLSFASSLSTLITPNSTATSTMDYLARGNQETCDKSKRLLENALSLASSLSLQSCFDFRAMRENNESYKRGQKKFSSVEGGDPFTIKSAFEAWLQMCVKAGSNVFDEDEDRVTMSEMEKRKRNSSGQSRQWCYRHGLQESRMYEMAKLRTQLQQVITKMLQTQRDTQTLTQTDKPTSSVSSSSIRGDIKSRFQMNHIINRVKSNSTNQEQLIRSLKREAAQSDSSRRQLTLADSEVHKMNNGDNLNEPIPETAFQTVDKDKSGDGMVGKDHVREEDDDRDEDLLALDEGKEASAVLDDFDLHKRMNLKAWKVTQKDDSGHMGKHVEEEEQSMSKLVLLVGLYPNLALPDPHNATRPLNEYQYVTRQRGGLYMQPSCSLNMDFEDQFPEPSSSSSSYSSSKPSSSVPKHKVPSQSRNNEIYVFSHLLETHKPFLTSVFKIKPHLLFLIAKTIDIDIKCSKVLFDHWLLIEFKDLKLGKQCIIESIKLRKKLEVMYEKTFPSSSSSSSLSTTVDSLNSNTKFTADVEVGVELCSELKALRVEWLQHEKIMFDNVKVKTDNIKDDNSKDVPRSDGVELSGVDASDIFIIDTIGNSQQQQASASSSANIKECDERGVTNDNDESGNIDFIHELEVWLNFDWKCINLRKLQGATLERLLFDPFKKIQASSELSHVLRDPLGILDGLWRYKEGYQITPYLRIGSLRNDKAEAELPSTISQHMFSKWTCPSCQSELFVNLEGVKQHMKFNCQVLLTQVASSSINNAIENSFIQDKIDEDVRRKESHQDGVRSKKRSRKIGTAVKGSKK